MESKQILNFEEAVLLKFGNKVKYDYLHINQFTIDLLNKQDDEYDENNKYDDSKYKNLTIKDIEDYGKHLWLNNKNTRNNPCCPRCNAVLIATGFTGAFDWNSLNHNGLGHCSNCKCVEFKYYHFLGKCKDPITAFEIYGFVEEKIVDRKIVESFFVTKLIKEEKI